MEVLILGGAFFISYFGWIGFAAHQESKAPRDLYPWEKRPNKPLVGKLDSDSPGAGLPLGEADEYVRRQVEVGQG